MSGTFGNATLATRTKGRILVAAQVDGMLAEIERLGAPMIQNSR